MTELKVDLTAILVGGLPGSGKSLLCQALAHLLGGQHLNQDEVEVKYAGQQDVKPPIHFFLQLVESTASRPSVRYLLVDSKFAKKSTREAVAAAVACGFAQRNIRDGDVSSLNLVWLSLTASDEALELCAARIVQRSLRHVALIPQAAHGRVVLEAMWKDVEPITPQEEGNFDVCAALDMTLPISELVSNVLEVLPCLSSGFTSDQISSAIRVAHKIEKDLSLRWVTLYWKVEILPRQASVLLSNLDPWLSEACDSIQARHAVGAQHLEDLHITVLWTGSSADAEEKLLAFEGQEVTVAVTSLCCDAELGLVAARVSLDESLQSLCENPDPHITVAKLPGVAAKQSNGVLLRQREADPSVRNRILPAPLQVTGVVHRHLSVEAMASATAALVATLPEGNPLCELGLSASRKSLDLLAHGPSVSDLSLPCRTSQPLQHCRWPPKVGKVWLTIHEQPLSNESRRLLDTLENQGSTTLQVAVCYVYIAENLLQKTYPKLLSDLEQRLTGRCLEAVQHAYQCLNTWRPQAEASSTPSFSLHCSGAGEHRKKLEEGLVAVMSKVGWRHQPGAALTISAEFKEDWILLALNAPKMEGAVAAALPVNMVQASVTPESNGKTAIPPAIGACTMDQGVMMIDGSYLGGGGHILRTAMTYAAVLGMSVGVRNVRSGSPGATGLQSRDVAILDGLKKIGGGRVEGATVGSSCVTFRPEASSLDSDFVIDTGSGAITHAVQTVLPVMLARSASLGGSDVEICFQGGTNLCCLNGEGGFEISPQIEYIKLVLFPVLRRLFGITLALDVRKKGFASGGEVWVRCATNRWPLSSFELLERGDAASVAGVTYSSTGIPRNVLSRFLQGQLRKKDAGASVVLKEALPSLAHHITCQADLPADDGNVACGLVLAIITTTGCCFGGDSMGRKGFAAEAVGEEAARQALRGFQRGGCADEYLEDQLVMFMTIATGKSRLRLGSSSTSRSLHMQTALWLAERFGASVRLVPDAETQILEIDGIGDLLFA